MNGGRVSRGRRGFTLLELMVVTALLGVFLLLVPANLGGIGARSRLESSTNTIASVLTGAKEQAVIDGHEVIVEFHLYDSPGDDKGVKWSGWRYLVANKTHETPDTLNQSPSEAQQAPARGSEEDEWLELAWDTLPTGVRIVGYSVNREEWIHSPSGTIRVSFAPDGTVRPPHALRIESSELEKGFNTMTVRVNALTSLAEVIDGDAELTSKRDPSDFH